MHETPERAFRVGPFTLNTVLGSGGAGEVWGGVHQASQVPVALKVVAEAGAEDEWIHATFLDEARAAARLDHPHIVMVFDYGVLPQAVESETAHDLRAGQPYLVMELATGGTLEDRRGLLPWSELRSVLLALLDGLAHLHANDLVHRDLKPANVLVAGHGDLRPGVKLTDFGLARHITDGPSEFSSGTPLYMAPEQVMGEWADFGPWTDLYALGGLAWMMACRRPPIDSRGGAMRLMRNQVTRQPGPFRPRVAVPPGFEAWCRKLLASESWIASRARQMRHRRSKRSENRRANPRPLNTSRRICTRRLSASPRPDEGRSGRTNPRVRHHRCRSRRFPSMRRSRDRSLPLSGLDELEQPTFPAW